MTNIGIRILFIAFLSIAVLSGAAFCQQTAQTAEAPNVDAKADKLLRGMSDLLGNSKSFSFKTVEAHDRLNRDELCKLARALAM